MKTGENISIRFNNIDKAALKELATRLQRNQSETVRTLIKETLSILKERDAKQEQQKITARVR